MGVEFAASPVAGGLPRLEIASLQLQQAAQPRLDLADAASQLRAEPLFAGRLADTVRAGGDDVTSVSRRRDDSARRPEREVELIADRFALDVRHEVVEDHEALGDEMLRGGGQCCSEWMA